MLGLGVNKLWNMSSKTDEYAVNSIRAGLVAAFDDEYYRANGGQKPFNDVITHSRLGQATMTDSDGLIKWAPHNLLTYSENLTNTWSGGGVTSTSSAMTSDSSTGFHYLQQAIDLPKGSYTFKVKLKANGYNYAGVRFVNDSFGSDRYGILISLLDGTFVDDTAIGSPVTSYDITDAGDGFYILTVTMNHNSGLFYPAVCMNNDETPSWAAGLPTFTGDGSSGIYATEMHLYRSDLGGMVDNPDRGDSYVPTTSSAVYLPRRGHHVYNGYEWVNEGVLAESEARTNLVEDSKDITTAYWSNIGGLRSSEISEANPTNESVSKFSVNALNSNIRVFQTQSRVTSVTSTVSGLFKASGISWIKLRIDESGLFDGAFFDLANGVIGTVNSGITATIKDYGNGWYRCSVSGVAADNFIGFSLAKADGDVDLTSYSGSLSDGVFVTALQWEAGSTPSSDIPTSGSSVTRAAETFTIPSAKLPYNSTAMSIQMDGRVTYADEDSASNARFVRWYTDADNYINYYLRTVSTRTGSITFEQEANNVYDSLVSSDVYSPDILVPFNISGRHGSTFVNGAVDGIALTADTTPTALPDLSSTDLDLAYDYMGTIKTFRIWDKDLGDAGIAEATS